MVMKMYQALEFEGLYGAIRDKKVGIRTGYKLSQLFEKLKSDIEFYRTQHQKILNEFAQKDGEGQFILSDDGQRIKIQEDRLVECEEAFKELSLLDLEMPEVSFKVEELESMDLSFKEIEVLMPFITED